MTEQEWLACDNSRTMLQYLRSMNSRSTKTNRRKLRLFGCGVAYRIWRLLDEHFREVVVIAERVADRIIDSKERQKAYTENWETMLARQRSPEPWEGYAVRTAFFLLGERPFEAAFRACAEEEWAYAWSEEPHSLRGVGEQQERAAKSERKVQANLLRDVIGNPFRPVSVDAFWQTETVVALARTIYDDRAFDEMPILADALEESGCTNTDILAHCRGPGPHVRGCWAVDLLLGKE